MDEAPETSRTASYEQYELAYHVELNSNAIMHGEKHFAKRFSNPVYREELRRFSNEILEFYEANRETAEDYDKKMSSMAEIRHIIQKYRRGWKFKLFPSGSTVTQLATKGSDLDVTIWLPRANRYFSSESEAAFNILRIIRHYLLIDPDINYRLESIRYVEALVPILKIKWNSGLEIDLSCCTEEYVSGIQNSYLIRGFGLWDRRFAPLCVFIKEWAARNDVRSPTDGGFNSYAMVLLVVHFLQCGVFPPVLPNLQELFPKKYARNCNGELRFPKELDFGDMSFPNDAPILKKSELQLAELFILFLDYYSRFDFSHHYICMRDAAVRWRDGRDGPERIQESKSVFIRDPMDDHNPGRTVREVEFVQRRIKKTLRLFMSSEKLPSLSELLENHQGANSLL